MAIQRALPVRGGNAIQRITHVSAHIVVPVLVERERTAGVLHEQIEHADLVVAQLGQLGHDLVGDQVGAAAARGESEGFLEPGHAGRARGEAQVKKQRKKQSHHESSRVEHWGKAKNQRAVIGVDVGADVIRYLVCFVYYECRNI